MVLSLIWIENGAVQMIYTVNRSEEGHVIDFLGNYPVLTQRTDLWFKRRLEDKKGKFSRFLKLLITINILGPF